MRRRLMTFVVLALLATASAAPGGRAVITQDSPLVAHEWGTFTSVAGPTGEAVPWMALGGQQDLPCFVERFAFCIKCSLTATVRMETPVIYFYASRPTTVSVNVRFPQGLITEWFPHASVKPLTQNPSTGTLQAPGFAGTASWPSVAIAPAATEHFPDEGRASHYYLARATAASPVRVGDQDEKFLFYRGIGVFQPPLTATVGADDLVTVRARANGAVGDVIRFENRGGTMAYDVRHAAGASVTIASPRLEGETVPPTAELERILIAHGLFPAEARAMVATWRDSWFEEGSRLFYVLTSPAVDAILPLEIQPRPTATVRVFVGRIELPTSTTTRDIRAALEANNQVPLARYARFAPALAQGLLAAASPANRDRWLAMLNGATFVAPAPGTACR